MGYVLDSYRHIKPLVTVGNRYTYATQLVQVSSSESWRTQIAPKTNHLVTCGTCWKDMEGKVAVKGLKYCHASKASSGLFIEAECGGGEFVVLAHLLLSDITCF